MRYAILCYHDERIVWSWSETEEAAVMGRLRVVRDRLVEAGAIGPSARLMPTTAATTVRQTADLVIDGPFAETKEQLLGFYIVEVADLEAAIGIARDLAKANPGAAYEIRPVSLYYDDPRRRAPE